MLPSRASRPPPLVDAAVKFRMAMKNQYDEDLVRIKLKTRVYTLKGRSHYGELSLSHEKFH